MATEVRSPITGTVWKLAAREGDCLSLGQPFLYIESMKMEVPVEAPTAGKLATISVAAGQAVEQGQLLGVIE